MPSQIIGRVQPVNQGNYDATRAYVVLDRVKHQGAWYECQADAAAGTAPEAGGNAYWLEIGGKGANGLTPTPVWSGTELHFAYSDGTTTSAVDLQGPQGIQVYIGEETPMQSMKDCSIVTATYELEEGMQGTIGIIGPKRMDYDKVLKTLKSLKNQLDSLYKRE